MGARSATEAMNTGDLETYLKDWDENATFVYPGNTSASGEISGKKAIRAWFEHWRTVFPDLKFTVKNIYLENNFYIGADNTMAVHWEALGTNKFGQQVHSTGIGVVTIKGFKVVRVQDYIFDADKLREFWGE
jgi:ketosteroid isomerase-like protein